jgi:hypothetical protein
MHPTTPSPEPITVAAAQLRPGIERATLVAVGTAGPPAQTASIDEQLNALRLDIQARALCWLSGTVDGRRVIYRLLNAGERIQIEAKDIVLRMGDAANLEYTINGIAGRPLGSAGQAITVHLTPQNYQEFLNH